LGKRLVFEVAQATLRKEYPEPYYWAAFVLIE
jgi:CHAT domain-containing protein